MEHSSTVRVSYLGKVYEFEGRLRAEKVLQKLNINPEEVLVIQGNRLVPPDELVEGEIEIRPVISGG